jgi:anion-transporting  ArsA/GET3 family ATPase
MSLDPGPSLDTTLGLSFGTDPVAWSPGLQALRVDPGRELDKRFPHLAAWTAAFMGLPAGPAAERANPLGYLPGVRELLGLARLCCEVDRGEYSQIIVDAPPAPGLLDLLLGLDAAVSGHSGSRNAFDLLRRLAPLAGALGLSSPSEVVLQESEALHDQMAALGALTTDHTRLSVRLVLQPAAPAIDEAMYAWTRCCLQGLAVDGFVVRDGWMSSAPSEIGYLESKTNGMPLVWTPWQTESPVGPAGLLALGKGIYGAAPAAIWAASPPLVVTEAGDGAIVRQCLPFARKGEFQLVHSEGRLMAVIRGRGFPLRIPSALAGRPIESAEYQRGALVVRLGPESRARSGKAVRARA